MTEVEWNDGNDVGKMLGLLNGTEVNETFGSDSRDKVSNRKLRLFACACCRQVWHLLTDDAPCPACNETGKVKRTPPPRLPGNYPMPDEKCEFCKGTGRINRSHRAVEVADRYADGLATVEEFHTAWDISWRAGLEALPRPSPLRAVSWLFGRTDSPGGTTAEVCAILEPYLPPATQAALLRDIVGNPWTPVLLAPGPVPPPLDSGRCPLCGKVAARTGCGPCARRRSPWLTPTVEKISRRIYDERDFDALPILADALEDADCINADVLAHCRAAGLHARGCWAVDLCLGKE